MISDLPRDLVEEIFSRLPFKSMRSVRLTCRKWETLCKSQSFTKMHSEKASSVSREGESQMIMLMNCNLYLKSVVFDIDPSIEPKGKLTCLNEQVKISQVFHCDGLLLCVMKDDARVVVWNPYLGQTRWIEPRYSHQGVKEVFMDKYALGYVYKDRCCRSHKILRFREVHIPSLGNFHKSFQKSTKFRFLWLEIYDFDSCLWKTLDVIPDWRISYHQRGVSLKGNTYWCAKNSDKELESHVICFDFTKERFGPLMPLPFSVDEVNNHHVTLSSVREEKLAVSLQHKVICPNKIKIWITTTIEAEKVSWTKFLTMDMRPGFVGFPFEQSFFIDEEKKMAMGFYKNYENSIRNIVNFIGEDGYFRELEDLGECAVKGCRASVCPYVPSSVQIKQLAGGKRKKESNLEELRFDIKKNVETCRT